MHHPLAQHSLGHSQAPGCAQLAGIMHPQLSAAGAAPWPPLTTLSCNSAVCLPASLLVTLLTTLQGDYYEAVAKAIDVQRKELVACFPKDAGLDEACFKISYDILIVGVSLINKSVDSASPVQSAIAAGSVCARAVLHPVTFLRCTLAGYVSSLCRSAA
jgi:hypothetical protein